MAMDMHATVEELLETVFSMWKHSAYLEIQTPLSTKRRPHFETHACLGENKDLGYGSQGDFSQE
jgi:hypothetical protein